MKEIDKYLCLTCVENLKEAQLIFKEIQNTRDVDVCEWCHRRRYGAVYRIQYERKR